jgi:hypothetical protein
MTQSRRVATHVRVGGREVRRDGYFDHWQDRAIERLRKERLWAISAPTGSGKSAVQTALLSMHPGKSLLVSPQSLILGSLCRPMELKLRDGERVSWRPAVTVIEQDNSVDRVITFLQEKPDGSATCVCTTASLSAVYKQLVASDRLQLLRDVAVSFDEAHHAENDLHERNRQGEVLEWLVRHGRAPVGASTATWFRSNLNEILPERESWTWYRHAMQDYLAGLRYLQDITMGFIVGEPERALHEMLSQGLERSIVYVPPPGTRYGHGTKAEQLARLLQVCGPYKDEHPFRVHKRRRGGQTVSFRSSDLVTIDGRDGKEGRKRAHIDRVRADPPEIIFALYLGMEGYDDPSLQRGLLIGARNSSVMRLQALGRLLRDVPGKTWAEFFITIPPLVGLLDARTYLTEIVAILADMDWRIRPARLEYDVRSEEERERFDMQRAMEETLGEVLKHPAIAEKDLKALVASVVRDQKVTDERAYVDDVLERLHRIGQSVAASDLPGIGMVNEALGAMERLSTTLTKQSLLQMRAACGYDLNLSMTEIRAAVRRYKEECGRWPNPKTREPVPGLEGVSWLQMHGAACSQGNSLDLAVDEVREQGRHYRASG